MAGNENHFCLRLRFFGNYHHESERTRLDSFMKTVKTIIDLRQELAKPHNSKRVALVPTMGCLHDGHTSLIKLARELADTVIVSIYVNPLQFGPDEDFEVYPRTFEHDESMCREAGVDVLFHPKSLYGNGKPKVSLIIHEMDKVLCGASRPGHFNGVATAVSILFNIVQPDVAVFGEKDWQQLAIIRRMIADLAIPTSIIGAPTVREPDGLALSSRNRYLTKGERKKAAGLFRSLSAIQKAAGAKGSSVETLLNIGRKSLRNDGIEPEYLDIRDAETLMDPAPGRQVRAFVAAHIGNTRLIDNIALHELE